MKLSGLLLLTIAVLFGACSPNNVKEAKEWEKYFAKYKLEGTFMMFNNGQGTFRVYNIDRAKQRFLPASTFKIFNSLTALHTGAASDTNMVIKWDGVLRADSAWNRDLTMAEAFHLSSVPYFQELARRIGKDTMQTWLDSVGYGNKKISRIDTFWLDNSLQISPDEQLGLVKQLYFNQLPYQKRAQQLVCGMMTREKTDKYILAYKGGWGITGKKQIGWMVGWVEENLHPTFFVLNFETEDPNADIESIRMEITRGILEEEGFFKGEK
ncbi:MAG: class D beta-lactamase [Chitinophaga sp.]